MRALRGVYALHGLLKLREIRRIRSSPGTGLHIRAFKRRQQMAQTRCLIAACLAICTCRMPCRGIASSSRRASSTDVQSPKLQKGRRHHDFANPIGRSRRERLCVGLAG